MAGTQKKNLPEFEKTRQHFHFLKFENNETGPNWALKIFYKKTKARHTEEKTARSSRDAKNSKLFQTFKEISSKSKIEHRKHVVKRPRPNRQRKTPAAAKARWCRMEWTGFQNWFSYLPILVFRKIIFKSFFMSKMAMGSHQKNGRTRT